MSGGDGLAVSFARFVTMKTVLLLVACLALVAGRASAQTASQLYTEAAQVYEAGNVESAKQKLRLALEVDKNFRPAAVLLARITADERQAGAAPSGASVQSLGRVFVPVDLNNTTLQTAIEILRQRIGESSGGKVAPNFVLRLPPDLANKKVTLHLDRVPATEAMRYLGSAAGVDFKVEQYAITVTPAAAAPAPTP